MTTPRRLRRPAPRSASRHLELMRRLRRLGLNPAHWQIRAIRAHEQAGAEPDYIVTSTDAAVYRAAATQQAEQAKARLSLPPLPITPVDERPICPVDGCRGALFLEGDEVLCRKNERTHRWLAAAKRPAFKDGDA